MDMSCETTVFHSRSSAYCIIVGVLNEGERFTRQLARMQSLRPHCDIIIADGGSSDGATLPEKIADKVHALLVCRQGGGLSAQYQAAFAYALSAGYEGVLTVDGNGKDGVEAAPSIIEALKGGSDLVQGSRFLPGGSYDHTPLDRSLGIRYCFNPVLNFAAKSRYSDGMNGFRGYSRALLSSPQVAPLRPGFHGYSLQYYLNYIAPRLGFRVAEVPVTRTYPPKGRTPSKIRGLNGRIRILRELARVCRGGYNVP